MDSSATSFILISKAEAKDYLPNVLVPVFPASLARTHRGTKLTRCDVVSAGGGVRGRSFVTRQWGTSHKMLDWIPICGIWMLSQQVKLIVILETVADLF